MSAYLDAEDYKQLPSIRPLLDTFLCSLDHYSQLPGPCLGYKRVISSQTVVKLLLAGQQCPLGARQAVVQISDAVDICCPETRNVYGRSKVGGEPGLRGALVDIVNI